MIKSQKGFTFIEIMVVVIIIASLAAIITPNIMKRLDEANVKITKTNMANLESAIKLFKLDNGFYPDSQQGLSALVSPPTIGREARSWNGPYLGKSQVPLDAWSNDFVYLGPEHSNNGTYTLRSLGEDGVPNTGDDILSTSIE